MKDVVHWWMVTRQILFVLLIAGTILGVLISAFAQWINRK